MFEQISEFFSDFNAYKFFMLLIAAGIIYAIIVSIVGVVRYFINGWPQTKKYLFFIIGVAVFGALIAMNGAVFAPIFFLATSIALIVLIIKFIKEMRVLEEFPTYMALIAGSLLAAAVLILIFWGLFSMAIKFTMAGVFELIITAMIWLRLY
ncbi:MAG: hypothetical protein RRY79_07480 [Clostridia bacterium]